MRKKVPVQQLTVGMFVIELCGSWLDHPFWKSSFRIADDRMLRALLDSPVKECWIDVAQGPDIGLPSPRAAAVPADAPSAAAVAGPSAEAEPASAPRAPLAAELERAAGLTLQAKKAVTALFNEVRLGKALDTSGCVPLVDDIAASVWRHPGAFVSLARLKSRDDYTYLHSVAVCALMVSLSRALGQDEEQARAAGLAGLLHDIGKATVPVHLLQKPGKLDDAEFAEVRRHPERGHALLLEGGESSAEALDVCLHHHERWDGKGYPHRIAGEQISLMARMGAVCDVYDAITSNRPYKASWDPADSLARMAEWGGHFDQTVFHAFVRTLGIYPVGALVKLQSGRLAVVIEPNEAKPLLPRVRAFFSTKSGMQITPVDLDLAAPTCHDRIAGRESNKDWNFRHLDELWAGRETLRRLGKL
jgi:HD-GYP domain-containing protein (c-di-GMP phosphodiesterase class II)